jgi:predicted nuclease of predicted toxin-antitoxin system
MRVYLDDDLDSNALLALLQRAGHEVLSPRAVGTQGAVDQEHLRYATEHALLILTANGKDLVALHREWSRQQRPHHGVLVVYRENNPTRDMSFEQIANAVTRVEQAAVPLENTVHVLNRWR